MPMKTKVSSLSILTSPRPTLSKNKISKPMNWFNVIFTIQGFEHRVYTYNSTWCWINAVQKYKQWVSSDENGWCMANLPEAIRICYNMLDIKWQCGFVALTIWSYQHPQVSLAQADRSSNQNVLPEWHFLNSKRTFRELKMQKLQLDKLFRLGPTDCQDHLRLSQKLRYLQRKNFQSTFQYNSERFF